MEQRAMRTTAFAAAKSALQDGTSLVHYDSWFFLSG